MGGTRLRYSRKSANFASTYTWRTVRIAEDPENQDIAAANCSVVFVQNLNQYNNGVTMA